MQCILRDLERKRKKKRMNLEAEKKLIIFECSLRYASCSQNIYRGIDKFPCVSLVA